MAKIVYIDIATKSGKVGGKVSAKNRGGNYDRMRVVPVNPQTTAQTSVRSNLTGLTQGWAGLSQARIAAWNAAAALVTLTDRVGNKIKPSGINYYVRQNRVLHQIGQSAISDPPPSNTVVAVNTLTVAAAKGAGTITATFAPVIDALTSVIVKATPGVSAGKNFVKSEYRQIGVLTTADTSPKNIASMYASVFGTVPVAGKKLFISFTPVTIATGAMGQDITASCIVAA